jgi:hypothetical protein
MTERQTGHLTSACCCSLELRTWTLQCALRYLPFEELHVCSFVSMSRCTAEGTCHRWSPGPGT